MAGAVVLDGVEARARGSSVVPAGGLRCRVTASATGLTIEAEGRASSALAAFSLREPEPALQGGKIVIERAQIEAVSVATQLGVMAVVTVALRGGASLDLHIGARDPAKLLSALAVG